MSKISDSLKAGRRLADCHERIAQSRIERKRQSDAWGEVIKGLEHEAEQLARAIRTGEYQPELFLDGDPDPETGEVGP